jgi:hypothetical protein
MTSGPRQQIKNVGFQFDLFQPECQVVPFAADSGLWVWLPCEQRCGMLNRRQAERWLAGQMTLPGVGSPAWFARAGFDLLGACTSLRIKRVHAEKDGRVTQWQSLQRSAVPPDVVGGFLRHLHLCGYVVPVESCPIGPAGSERKRVGNRRRKGWGRLT